MRSRFVQLGGLVAIGALMLATGCSDEPDQASGVGHIESALTTTWIARGSTWKYLDDGSSPDTSWSTLDFDDSTWKAGAAELGYGDGDEATTVSYGGNANDKHITTFFRKVFQVAPDEQISGLTLTLKRDDGAVVYLNGTEIFRDNMPESSSYDTPASSVVEDDDIVRTAVPVTLLDPGRDNVLAVEVHQQSARSSDLSFDAELTRAPSGYGFFVMSDVHATSSSAASIARAVRQMRNIDPHAIAGIAAGDLTMYGTDTELGIHKDAIQAFFDPTAEEFGGAPRYLSAVGNHDCKYNTEGDWYTAWNAHLPGQRHEIGINNANEGIFFEAHYESSLFVMLDAQHTDRMANQDRLLAMALSNSRAQFKFVFWHDPVYPCWADSAHPPFGTGLAWVDIAERMGVDVVFNGHSHVYSRSCPKYQGSCKDDGVVYVETGSLGSTSLRTFDRTSFSVSGTVNGKTRSETYECVERSTDPAGHLDAKLDGKNTFCHVGVNGCVATVDCYAVGNSAPIDSWTIDHCE